MTGTGGDRPPLPRRLRDRVGLLAPASAEGIRRARWLSVLLRSGTAQSTRGRRPPPRASRMARWTREAP
ncbi:hypothetical protein ACR6C2_30500 [Streptomyces sp. INA 01156]